MKSSAIVSVAAIAVALSGCASIIRGTSQSIAITTPPTTGAQCTLSSKEGNWLVTSPGEATVEKSKEDIQVRCTKPGFQDGVASIPSDFDGWTVGNLVAGGVIGFGVDAATGAINEYPHSFQVPMMPIYGYVPPPSGYAPASTAEALPDQQTTAAGSDMKPYVPAGNQPAN
jgi:hypothetical protein